MVVVVVVLTPGGNPFAGTSIYIYIYIGVRVCVRACVYGCIDLVPHIIHRHLLGRQQAKAVRRHRAGGQPLAGKQYIYSL